jgi:hypothetical protein
VTLHTHDITSRRKVWPAIVLVLIAWLILSVGFYYILVVSRGYRFDFTYRWIAGRAALAGQDPYSQPVSHAIYQAMFGKDYPLNGYLQGFSNPAYHLLLFVPLYYLPFQVAVSLWGGLQFLFLFAALIIGYYLLTGGKFPSSPTLAWLVFYCVFYRYSMINLTFAQFVIFQILLTLLVLLAAAYRRDWLCGLCLALTTNHPAFSVALVIVVLSLALFLGRWKIIASFLLGLLGMMLASIIWVGWWLPSFLESTRNYAGLAPWPLADCGIGAQVLVVIAGLLVGGLAAIALCQPDLEMKRDGVGLLTGISLYLIPQTNLYNLSFLLIFILAGWANLKNRWLRLAWLGGWWLLPWINWASNEAAQKTILWIVYITILLWGICLAIQLWRRRQPGNVDRVQIPA